MLPLEGIRVLDLTRFAPGLYCTMMLGDLGAEVLRIDQPRSTVKTDEAEIEKERAAAARTMNRNKKSIVLNLKSAEAREIFCKLCRSFDVVVEGFRPGVAKRLGIDYGTLSKLNPGLVYCSITGYGQSGPYCEIPGHDINYISIAGALSMIGQKGSAPTIPVNFIGDYAGGGLQAVIGILTALLVRVHTKTGQHVDISMTDGTVSIMAAEYSNYFATGIVPSRAGTRLNGGRPYYNVYETKDGGYISVACSEPRFWRNLCHALGRDDLIPRQFDQGKKMEEVFGVLKDVFLTRTRDYWFERLGKEEICISKVLNLQESSRDPQLLERQMFIQVGSTQDKTTQVGIPIKLSKTAGRIRTAAPVPGQHTSEVLAELGYSVREIASLRLSGAVA